MCLIINKETLSKIDLKRDVMIHEGAEVRISCIRNARVYKKKSLNQDELYAIGVQFKN